MPRFKLPKPPPGPDDGDKTGPGYAAADRAGRGPGRSLGLRPLKGYGGGPRGGPAGRHPTKFTGPRRNGRP